MKTIDRQYESLSTKDMGESTQPYFDKFYRATPQKVMDTQFRVMSRISDHCYCLGLRACQPCIDLGWRLLSFGDDEDTAVRKACELATDMAQHRSAT